MNTSSNNPGSNSKVFFDRNTLDSNSYHPNRNSKEKSFEFTEDNNLDINQRDSNSKQNALDRGLETLNREIPQDKNKIIW